MSEENSPFAADELPVLLESADAGMASGAAASASHAASQAEDGRATQASAVAATAAATVSAKASATVATSAAPARSGAAATFFGADLLGAAAQIGSTAVAATSAAAELAAAAEMPVLEDDAPFELPAPTAAARIVTYAHGKQVAFAPHATQEFVEKPQWLPVPGGAYYAYGLLYWQNRHIPFIHLESLLLAYPAFDAQVASVPYALVLAYQAAPHAPLQYGAIAVTDIPQTKMVSDADFSPLPNDSDMWAELAISCFRQNGQTYPILDAAKIFSQYHG